MKKLLLAGIATAAMAAPTAAFAQDVSYTIGTDVVSEYVFRGQSFGGTSVQPYAEASVGNFTAGIWASAGVGAESDVQSDEVDLYAGYSVPLDGDFSLDLGVTYYHYPQSGALFETEDGGAGSYEFSAAVGFDTAFSPSLAAYYDVTLEAFTLEGGIGHSVELNDDYGLDLGLSAGLVQADGPGDYEYATASIAITHAFSESVGWYVGGNFSVNSENNTLDFERIVDPASEIAFATADSDTKLWFGTGISVGFE